MKTTLLNPYSIQLEKHPFMEVNSEPCFMSGDFRIYKYYEKHFLHTFKNIIISERCGKNIDLIENVKKGIIPPLGDGKRYHEYERPKEAMIFGIEQAKKLNFKIQ